VERFIHYYFERFDKLKQPSFHPKWKEVNLTARVPGWVRYAVVEEMLAAVVKDRGAAKSVGSIETVAGGSEAGSSTHSPLFREFLEWQQKNRRNQINR